MPEDATDRAYELLIEQCRARGEIDGADRPNDQRSHPRVRFDAAPMTISGGAYVDVVDMSISGVAFLTEYAYAPGERLVLAPDGVLSAPAEVVSCRSAHDVDEVSEPLFRVSCRFLDSNDGIGLLLLTKELRV
jgi:hypothetical protein